jgi:hypothetical protein
LAFALASTGLANTTYLTDFTKDNNIFTNLNEQYPTTGVGVPGSGVGTANASFLFDPSASAVITAGYAPNYVIGSNQVNNGIDFKLTSNSTGQDFAQVGPGAYSSVILTANLDDVTNVYLLMGAYDGVSTNVTFTGANSATESFNNISIPDFNGGSINSGGTGFTDQTVFQVQDVGAGGTGNSTNGAYNRYGLTEVGFTLDSSLNSQELSSITITSNGYMTLLLGATAVTPNSVSSAPEATSTLALLVLAGIALLGGQWTIRARSWQS